jgi:fatty-acyl-CoA synthase
MTETGPLACASRPRRRHAGLGPDERRRVRAKTGYLLAGLEGRLVADDGSEVPWDGETVGELQVRGPWVATDYWRGAPEKFDDCWLRTGDMATMEHDGYFTIVDRSKDLVKSGGEWVSSVELEGACLAHPAIREAAVVGVRSEKWDERPVVVAALHEGASVTLEELREFLTGRVAKWWLPDDLVVVDEVAKTSVGKYDKKVLRACLADRVLP